METCKAILFADLDGTVLDRERYEPGPALEALETCRGAGISVVLNSSKTRTEMEVFHETFPILPGSPFITENGGGIFFPSEGWHNLPGAESGAGFLKVTLGASHDEVLGVLKTAAESHGLDLRLFSEMTPEEISLRTRLSPPQAVLAKQREFDEPFWIEGEGLLALDAFQEEIEHRGMRLSRGGRCFHVHGVSDKGKAAHYVKERYREVCGPLPTAGVGDAENDMPLFRNVGIAYLVKGEGGLHDPAIPKGGNIRFLEGRGPAGFVEAVEDFLGRRKR